jgi:hypothetical protein
MRLLIAGGGTGGHLFPGVAIAEELRARDPAAAVQFVGTARGIEARVLPELGWDLALIEVSGLKTVGALGAIKGLFRLPRALWQARRMVKQFKPDAVIGVGGYASGPVVLMARLAACRPRSASRTRSPASPTRSSASVVRAVFLSFEESKRFFKAKKVVMSGNPVRRELLRSSSRRRPPSAARRRSTVLVSGGSLGAVAVNELASQALIELIAKERSLSIVHQTGEPPTRQDQGALRAAGVIAECSRVHQGHGGRSTPRRSDRRAAPARPRSPSWRSPASPPSSSRTRSPPTITRRSTRARWPRPAPRRSFKQADLTGRGAGGGDRRRCSTTRRRARRWARAMRELAHPGAAAAVVDWCAAQKPAQAPASPGR